MYYEVYHRREDKSELIGVFLIEEDARHFAHEQRKRLPSGVVILVLLTGQGIQRTLERLSKPAPAETPSGENQRPATRLQVAACPTCETVFDIYKFRSRNTISKLMRSLLEEQVLTPTELLWDYTHLRRLQKDEREINLAISVIARMHSQDQQTTVKACLDNLYHLLDEVMSLAKACFHERASGRSDLPTSDVDALFEIVKSGQRDGQKLIDLTCLVAGLTRAYGHWAGKLERLAMIMTNGPEWTVVLLDQFLAELLDLPAAREEVLGAWKRGAQGIRPLINVLANRSDALARDPGRTVLASLAAAGCQDGARETRLRLWGWLRLQLKDDRTLSHWERQEEITQYRILLPRLLAIEDFLDHGPAAALAATLNKLLVEDDETLDIAETLAFVLAALPSHRERLVFLAALLREARPEWLSAIEDSLQIVVEALQAAPRDVAARQFNGGEAARTAFLESVLTLIRDSPLQARSRQFCLHILTRLKTDREPTTAEIDRLWVDLVGTKDWDLRKDFEF